MENWIKILECDNYSVSNKGRIRNDKTNKILKERLTKRGYARVSVNVNGKFVDRYIHRLVAQHFLNKPTEDHKEVNHKNAIKNDNRVENLEWVTHLENVRHSVENGLINRDSEKRKEALKKNRYKPKLKAISQYDLEGNFIKTFESALDIENELGYSRRTIINICGHKTRTNAYGFRWEYAN